MRRLIAICLTICLAVGCCSLCASAEVSAVNQAKAEALNTLGILRGVGTSTGTDFALEEALTRDQGIVMIIRMMGKEKEALACEDSIPFTDVKEWAVPYISYAFKEKITKGVSEQRFGYGEALTDNMFLTMLLRVFGYSDTAEPIPDFDWETPYELAKTIGVSDGKADADFIRSDMVGIVYSALGTDLREGDMTLGESLIMNKIFTQSQFDAANKKVTAAVDGNNSSGNQSGGGLPVLGGGGGGSTTTPPVTDTNPDSGGSGDPAEDRPNETSNINPEDGLEYGAGSGVAPGF